MKRSYTNYVGNSCSGQDSGCPVARFAAGHPSKYDIKVKNIRFDSFEASYEVSATATEWRKIEGDYEQSCH